MEEYEDCPHSLRLPCLSNERLLLRIRRIPSGIGRVNAIISIIVLKRDNKTDKTTFLSHVTSVVSQHFDVLFLRTMAYGVIPTKPSSFYFFF